MTDEVEVYEAFRDYIKHEDQLINYRMTWMLTIHGFLYATFGFTIQKLLEVVEKGANELASKICTPGFAEAYTGSSSLTDIIFETKLFLLFICAIGAVISGSAFYSVRAAYLAINAVRDIFENFRKSTPFELTRSGWPRHKWYSVNYDDGAVGMPLLTGGGRPAGASAGFWASWSIPGMLFLSWIVSIYCVLNYVHIDYYSAKGTEKWCPKTSINIHEKN